MNNGILSKDESINKAKEQAKFLQRNALHLNETRRKIQNNFVDEPINKADLKVKIRAPYARDTSRAVRPIHSQLD